MQYSSESLKQQPELTYTRTEKHTSAHPTAVKCHTNTFYRPPLTSLITTLNLKVGEKKGKQIRSQCSLTDSRQAQILCACMWFFLFFFAKRPPLFLCWTILCGIHHVNNRLAFTEGHQDGVKHAEIHIISHIASSFFCTGAKTNQ